MAETAFTLAAASLISLLGLLVVYNSTTERLRWWFLAFCLSLSFWPVTFLLSEKQSAYALMLNRLTFVGPLLAATFCLMFVKQLDNNLPELYRPKRLVDVLLALILTVIGSVLCVSPGVVVGIHPRLGFGGIFEGYDIQRGPLYFV